MNLIADALTVFGSRFGIGINPPKKECYLIKASDIKDFPFEIEAGIELEGKRIYLPLSSSTPNFYFHDQKLTPTTMQISGIDPDSGLHLKLNFMIPFRPRDVNFSTIPVIYISLKIEKLLSSFRWSPIKIKEPKGRIFLKIKSKKFTFNYDKNTKELEISYEHIIKRPPPVEGGILAQLSTPVEEKRKSNDRIAIISGDFDEEFYHDFDINRNGELILCWANYEEPILSVKGELKQFKYTESFKNIKEVTKWGKENYDKVLKNSKNVDSIFLSHNLGNSISNLMSMTLHSWLYDSWYVKLDEKKDWFSVWEGSCYFHSTVDVEYTQSPFYLSIWPELLELELDEWPNFAKDGEKVIGEKGKNTLYISHDMGLFANADRQYYPHDMEVEENANYILMAYSLWKRTGKDNIIRKHANFIQKLMDFILACDTTGNGIIDLCCANTIDDASPAIQFGKEQIYLAVKSMASILCGVEILQYVLKTETKKYKDFAKKARNTIEKSGWKDDHYIVTLTKSADGLTDPWTGKKLSGELEGWDSYHIYTENGLLLLEMIGKKVGLKVDRIKSDLISAVKNTLQKYGCRHSSYVSKASSEAIHGLVSAANKVGWISMNMARDIVACYYGIDMLCLSENYWDWQLTTNSQDIYLFFETFYGNNLNLYPRGLAIFGYMDAAAGFVYDKVKGVKKFKPIRKNIEVPIFNFADWENGKVLKIKT